MNKEYSIIRQLISLWEEYEDSEQKPNFEGFGGWLSNRESEGSCPNALDSADLSPETETHLDFYRRMPESRQFLTLLSRASRFIDFYMKKALEEIDLHSRLEFQFLVTIHEMRNPGKTDVIHFHLVEISTGVETLKRLIKKGLLFESQDSEDKRVRRVSLTPEGESVLARALERFNKLDRLTKSFPSEEKWRNFIPDLLHFNDSHNVIYSGYREMNLDQLFEKLRINN